MARRASRNYSRHLSGRRRSEAGDRRLGVILAFVAGAVNAGGFIAVGAYTSHMSGFVSGLADHMVLGRFGLALMAVIYVFSFFSGAVTSSLLINWGRLKRLQSEFALAIMLEAGLLLLFGLMAANPALGLATETVIALLCYIMGLQNSLITKASHAVIRTTHMTGVITDLGIEVGRYVFGHLTRTRTRFDGRKAAVLGALLLAFLLGGVVGAFGFGHYGFISVLPFSALLALVGIGPVRDDLLRRRRQKNRNGGKSAAPLETPEENRQLDGHDAR